MSTTAFAPLPGFEPILLGDIDEAADGAATIQIVNNVRLPGDDGALYTLFLPPGWTRNDNRPVLLSGSGAGLSNNARIYNNVFEPSGFDLFPAQVAAGGFIIALSNAGGTESPGIDPLTLESVGAFFEFIDSYGGNPNNAVTIGASRGGSTALVWAANSLNFNYNVHSVFALVPPTHLGSTTQVSKFTYPGLIDILSLLTHDFNAWQTFASFVNFVLESYSGTQNVTQADNVGPFGIADALQGKRVVISAGTHDAYVPLSQYLAFERHLNELGIDYKSIITLNNGHERSLGFEAEVDQHLFCMATGQCLPTNNGREYWIDIDPVHDDQRPLEDFLAQQGLPSHGSGLPVSLQAPFHGTSGSPLEFEVCGPIGAEVEVEVKQSSRLNQPPAFRHSFTIGESECEAISDIPSDTSHSFGIYHWSLTINGVEISPFNTPFDTSECHPAVTLLAPQPPPPPFLFPFSPFMNWGLDEYSASQCDG